MDWEDPRLDVAPVTPKRQRGDDSWIRRGGADDDEEAGMVAAVCEEEAPRLDIDDLNRHWFELGCITRKKSN